MSGQLSCLLLLQKRSDIVPSPEHVSKIVRYCPDCVIGLLTCLWAGKQEKRSARRCNEGSRAWKHHNQVRDCCVADDTCVAVWNLSTVECDAGLVQVYPVKLGRVCQERYDARRRRGTTEPSRLCQARWQ